MADIPGDTSTTATMAVGSNTTSTIGTLGDHDWYRVTLAAGQTITVTVTGAGNLDTYLNLWDPTGKTILAHNDDIVTGVNTNSRLTFTASAAGTYFVDVGAYNNQSTGAYDLFVEPSPPPTWTYDQIAYQLTNGYWGSDVHHFNVTQGGTITVNISSLNAAEQTLALAALQDWSDIIGVHFQQVTTGGQIKFSDTEDTSNPGPIAQTDAQWSNGIISSSNVQISTSWVNQYGTGLDTYSFQTYIHEIGHALGLGHAGEYNGNATYSTDALFANDAWSTTVMSYFSQRENTYFSGQGFTRNFVMTPMDADVVAMQQLYGLSTTTRTGNTTYGFNSNADNSIYHADLYPNAAYTIFDSGGTNTLDYSGFSANQLINLNPETFSNIGGSVGNVTIARGTLIQNAIGGSGNDTIIGNSANDVLTGGPGADTLTGGTGNDIFSDTKSGHNGDTITDFHAGDTILFTDATLNNFTFSLSGHTLNYSGGSMTLTTLPTGTLDASAAPGGGVDLALAPTVTFSVGGQGDFNGDGRTDVFWENNNGTVTDWLAQPDGTFAGNTNFLTQVPTDWHVVGVGDFNGDGRSDILWQTGTGVVTDWLGQPNGSFVSNQQNLSTQVDSTWHVVGTGDFNGDGRMDVLWQNTSGAIVDWLGQPNGAFAGNNASFTTAFNSSWHVAGTGDFNGDGITDILWRNDDGTVTDWLGQPNGSFVSNQQNVSTMVDSSWHIVGTGDFNGDGIDDVLWQNTSGAIVDWLGQRNGAFAGNNASFTTAFDSSWHVAGTGDFNGDGIDDILWRNDNGTVTEWFGQPNGSFVSNQQHLSTLVPTDWHVEPQEQLV